jgi:hypothetical protein
MCAGIQVARYFAVAVRWKTRCEEARSPMGSARTSARAGAAAVAIFLGLCGSSHAFDLSDSNDENLNLPGGFLDVPRELQREKRDFAKSSDKWVATMVGSLAGGFDSNIYDSPDDPQASGLGGFGAKLELLKYKGTAHRLKLTGEAEGIPQEQTSTASPYNQEGQVFYGYRPGSHFSLTTTETIEHQSGHATNIDGEALSRDFDYMAYQSSSGMELDFTRRNSAKLSYFVGGRDYNETEGMASLDWWKHGPRVEYGYELLEGLDLEAFYSFSFQHYVDNPASDSAGVESNGNPTEEHYFHTAGIEADATLRDVDVTVSATYRRKEDLYQDYESYSAYTAQATAEWSSTSRWSLQAAGRVTYRDFDVHAGSADGDPLTYVRLSGLLGVGYRLSEHVALFASGEYDNRDSNRANTATTYRDYARFRVMGGWTMAY